MSVSIVEILSGDKGLDLQNGYWARQPTILGNWNTIRIGARFHVPVSSSVATSVGFFRFGICSGATDVPGKVVDGDVDDALFFRSTLTSFTYNSGGAVQVGAIGAANIGKIESGSAATTTKGGVDYIGAISSGPAVIRLPLIITITKGSPYTFRIDRRTSTSGIADISLAQLYAAMEATDPDVSLGTGYADNSNTIAMDEATHGTLDTVFVTWAQSSPAVYVSEVLVARLA